MTEPDLLGVEPAAADPEIPAGAKLPTGQVLHVNPLASASDAPAHVAPAPAELAAQLRAKIVTLGNDCLTETRLRGLEHYSEGGNRLSGLAMAALDPEGLELYWDCSASVTTLYKWGGAPDPNKLGYGGDPYTGTLLAANHQEVPLADTLPADLIVYGGGTGQHVALVLERVSASDCWTFSNGGPTGAPPSRVLHSSTEGWMLRNGYPGVRVLRCIEG